MSLWQFISWNDYYFHRFSFFQNSTCREELENNKLIEINFESNWKLLHFYKRFVIDHLFARSNNANRWTKFGKFNTSPISSNLRHSHTRRDFNHWVISQNWYGRNYYLNLMQQSMGNLWKLRKFVSRYLETR